MTQTIAKDTIKDQLTSVLEALKASPSHNIDAITTYHTELCGKVETILDEYEAFRKVAEYMSGMVESLQKKLDRVTICTCNEKSENAEG